MFGCERGGGGCKSIERTKKDHLQLMFGCEGGGSHGRDVERTEKSTSSLCLNVREVEEVVGGVIVVSGVLMVSWCHLVLVARLVTQMEDI